MSAALATRLPVGRTGDELDRLAATFNRMLDRLQATFESQRRFVADASHELRTPLTAIRGNVDVLSRQIERAGDLPAGLSDGLADLRRESDRMSRLIEDLLLLAKSESLGTELMRDEAVRLDDVAREVAKVGATLATGQRIVVGELAPVELRADRDRLVQVGIILMENAIRHTAPGQPVTIAVFAQDNEARLVVEDSGQGIAPEHLPRIFDRFYRADDSRHRGSGGTGLGLAIAKAIVQAHGGRIGVTSAEGQGSTFTAVLPLDGAPSGSAAVRAYRDD